MEEDAYELAMKVPKARGLMGIISPKDVARAKTNVTRYPWARRIADELKEAADYWAAKSDEELYGLVPAENPRALVVNYDYGCPIHGGFYGTMEANFDQPDRWYCNIGGEQWYPGKKVKNPKTGEEITIEDDGSGWVAPEGFPNPGERYWFVAAYRLYRLGVLFKRPYATTATNPETGLSEAPECLMPLAYTYVLTGDRRYAHKALLLLNRLAELYRTFDGNADNKGTARVHIAEVSTTEVHYIRHAALACDLVFDAIELDEELLKFFSEKGGADYNGDGAVDADDIRYNIQRNLLGPMYELANRMVISQVSDWQLDYIYNILDLAACLGNGEMMKRGLEGPRGFQDEMINAYFRDGKHYYSSLAYGSANARSWVFPAMAIDGFSDGEVYKKPLDPFSDPQLPFRKLISFLREVDCDGNVPSMGDHGWGGGRERELSIGYEFSDEVALTGMPEEKEFFRQRLYGAARGDVNGARSNPWLLFHAEDFDPAGLEGKERPMLNRAHLFPASQIAILRSGDRPENRVHAGLHAARGAESHRHFDKLLLAIKAFGWPLTTDVNYWADKHLKHDYGPGWLRHTASHNLVVTDARNQEIATGIMHGYSDLPQLQTVDASCEDAYPGLSLYRRTFALLPIGPEKAYLVDIFRVRGGEKTHDYLFHSLSGEKGENFSIQFADPAVELVRQEGGSLAGPDVPYASQPGYSFIRDIEHAPLNGSFQATWRVGDAEETALRLWMPAMKGRQVFIGNAEGYGIFGRSPFDRYLCVREKAVDDKMSTFAAVIEPYQGKSFIDSVEVMEVLSGQEADPVCLRVRAGKHTDYVFQTLDPTVPVEARIGDEKFSFQGAWARISVSAEGKITSTYSEAEILKWEGHVAIEAISEVTGAVEQVDFSKNTVTVRPSGEVPPVETLKGKLILVANPAVSLAVPTAYIVGDVKRLPFARLDLELADPPTLLMSRGRVTGVNAEKKAITVKSGQIANCKRMLEGKRARKDRSTESKDYLITACTAGKDMQITFEDEIAAQVFKPGDEINFYDLGAGDRIRIICGGESIQ